MKPLGKSGSATFNPRHRRLSPTALGVTLPLPQPVRPPEPSSFVPKSTLQTRHEHAKLLAAAATKRMEKTSVKTSESSTQDSQGVGTSPRDLDPTQPSTDIFGLRSGYNGEDDFIPEEGDAEGFWMPDLAVVSEEPAAPKTPAANRPNEIFDGYHLWQEWQSRTAGKPFWHCKETGETRWEKPEAGAVQKPDRMPQTETADAGDLKDGAFDEEANRREFLQALYEWRNGGKSEPAAEEAKPEVTQRKAPAAKKDVEAAEVSTSRPTSARATVISRQASARAPQSASLQSAAGNGEAELVKEMLQGGADPNGKDRFGLTALHYAAGGGHVAIVELLAGANALLDSSDGDGDTPLHNAAKGGREAALRRLLELGADAGACNGKGNAPARVAAMFGRQGLVALLDRAKEVRASAVASGRGSVPPLSAGVAPPSANPAPAKTPASTTAGTSSVGTTATRAGTKGGTGTSAATVGSSAATSAVESGGVGAGEAAGKKAGGIRSSTVRGSSAGGAGGGVHGGGGGGGGVSANVQISTAKVMPVAGATRAGAGEEEVDVGELQKARALLEGLRSRAREEVEVKYGSRPTSAASSRGGK